jgi:hypothetical protein
MSWEGGIYISRSSGPDIAMISGCDWVLCAPSWADRLPSQSASLALNNLLAKLELSIILCNAFTSLCCNNLHIRHTNSYVCSDPYPFLIQEPPSCILEATLKRNSDMLCLCKTIFLFTNELISKLILIYNLLLYGHSGGGEALEHE